MYLYIHTHIYIFFILHLSNGVSSKLPEADGGQNLNPCADWPGHGLFPGWPCYLNPCADWPGHGLLPGWPCYLWHQICFQKETPHKGPCWSCQRWTPPTARGTRATQRLPRKTLDAGKKGDGRCARHTETHAKAWCTVAWRGGAVGSHSNTSGVGRPAVRPQQPHQAACPCLSSWGPRVCAQTHQAACHRTADGNHSACPSGF